MPVKTLTKILQEVNAPPVIDFFSLDAEGAELQVLRGLDFDKYKINCILVEHNMEKTKRRYIREFLIPKGYRRAETLRRDDLYELK
jgi:hypothetical protein